MADSKSSQFIPYLVLDFIGALLAGLGLLEILEGPVFVPESLRFPFYGEVMIVLGVLLMWPFIKLQFRIAREKAQKEQASGGK